jgi:hypothetical protein
MNTSASIYAVTSLSVKETSYMYTTPFKTCCYLSDSEGNHATSATPTIIARHPYSIVSDCGMFAGFRPNTRVVSYYSGDSIPVS